MDYLNTVLKKSSLYPVLIIESLISDNHRRNLARFSALSVFLFLGLTFVVPDFDFISSFINKEATNSLAVRVWGIVMISLSFYLFSKAISFYFNSFYYLDDIVFNKYNPNDIYTFTVGRILLNVSSDGDLVRGFTTSEVGLEIMERAGISKQQIKTYLKDRVFNSVYRLPIKDNEIFKLIDLVKWLYENDSSFAGWLTENDVQLEELIGATNWVVFRIESCEYKKRWWSGSQLSRIPGIAKDWGFGNTYNLDKYSSDILSGLSSFSGVNSQAILDKEFSQLENILSKNNRANVLIVGETLAQSLELVWYLGRKIKAGEVLSSLDYKRPVLLDSASFISGFKTKSELEVSLLKIFDEATRAGNIILVFDNFFGFLAGLSHLNVDFFSLTSSYLSGNVIQIIGLVDSDFYHKLLETNPQLAEYFDKIFVDKMPIESIVKNLEETINQVEIKTGLFFTYPAVLAIAHSAENYFEDGSSGDRSVDLLSELLPWAKKQRIGIVGQEEVESFIRQKTDIPVGEITEVERNKLLNLEIELQKKVVGQTEAITAISNALRRSRTGIRNPKKPIGSFLFVGPTGVGKTETAKALASVFFDNEENMIRLDMSEYQASDSIERLIGSAQTGKTGILAGLIKEKPYGVVLLDEFEKSDKNVLNLFLQILDEGFFSDMNGRRINARNLIFVATSNAGAETLWKMIKEGEGIETSSIIDIIVQQGIFRPELLNRFDSIVLFSPLSEDQLEKIAGLMLAKLANRLKKQGIELIIDDYLTKAVARLGANNLFGARPMSRFIQDKIEQQIADEIIRGGVKSGSSLSFVLFEESELPKLAVNSTIGI